MANEEMQKAFLADPTKKLAHRSAREKPAKKTTARSRIKTGQSDQWGTVEQAYRDGRKIERIEAMLKYEGVARCEDCGEVVATDVKTAMSLLDYSHERRRSQAQGYRPGKGGQNDAHFKLRDRACHSAYDGSNPRFGE